VEVRKEWLFMKLNKIVTAVKEFVGLSESLQLVGCHMDMPLEDLMPKKDYIHFSKIFNSFEENINLPKYLHGKDLIEKEGVEEEFSSESDNVTETEIEVMVPKKALNVGSMKALYHAGNLGSVFTTLNNALQIVLTLPVSSATTERTFSKLKIIKTRLRTTMTNTRLEDLMLITCEQDLYKNSNKVLETFASKSTELSKMLI